MLSVIKFVAGALFAVAAVLAGLAILLFALIVGFLWLYDLYCIADTAKERRRRMQQLIESQKFEEDKIAKDEYFLMFQAVEPLVTAYRNGLPLHLSADEVLDLMGAYLYARERYICFAHPKKIAVDNLEDELSRIAIAIAAGTK